MTTRLLLGPLCLALVGLPIAAPAVAQDQARLTIDENVYNVPIGKAFAVRIAGERVTLRIDPVRDQSFDEAGVAFRYPTSLEASKSGGEGVAVWTLQGPNAAVMLQRYEEGLDPKSLLEVMVSNIVEREAAQDAKQQAVKLTGPERAYQGVQLRTSRPASGDTPATESVQNVFTFANAEGVFALMLQDVHATGGELSEEYTEALRLLGESLTTGDEPPAPRADAAEGPRGDRPRQPPRPQRR